MTISTEKCITLLKESDTPRHIFEHSRKVNAISKLIATRLKEKGEKVDIDVVDSAFVPGTFRKETGGFTSRQLIYFLQRLNILKNLRVVDLVEINPDLDINNITVKLGSKILSEII